MFFHKTKSILYDVDYLIIYRINSQKFWMNHQEEASILFIHSRKRLTTRERKGVQDGNTIPGSSISHSSYEPGIREVTNNQLVTQTLVFPRCRLVRDFLIPELSYYKALLPLPRPFASFLTVAIVVASTVYKPNRIISPMIMFFACLFYIFFFLYYITNFFLFFLSFFSIFPQ